MSSTAFHEQRTYPDNSRMTAGRFTGLDFQAHWQQDCELIFITGGQQDIGINQQHLCLQSGHLVLIKADDIHYFKEPRQVNGFMFIFQDNWLNKRLAGPSRHWVIQDSDKLTELCRLAQIIVDEFVQRQPFYELAIEGYLQQFLTLLLRSAAGDACQIIDAEKSHWTAYMQDILSFIDEQFCSPLTRESIASQFHISVSHLTRLFRAATGQTLTDYLARKRIDSICRDLRQTDLPVTEIALRHGYASIRTFNRVFQNVMKKSPTDVRDEKAK